MAVCHPYVGYGPIVSLRTMEQGRDPSYGTIYTPYMVDGSPSEM